MRPPKVKPPEPDPKTLDLHLVWAKSSKSKSLPWWPSRVLSRSPDRLHLSLSLFANNANARSCPASQVKPFFNPDLTRMARRGSHSHAFLSSLRQALTFASLHLQSHFTCHCVPVPPPASSSSPSLDIHIGICNFTTLEFLNCIRDAALSVSAVNVEESVRLKSWVFALAQGVLSNGEPGFNQRKLTADLVDLDSNPCAHDHPDDDDDQCNADKVAKPTTKRKKKNNNNKGIDSAAAPATPKDEDPLQTSGRRQRKKSKYLSPPYTDIVASNTHKNSQEEKEDETVDKGGYKVEDFEALSVQDTFTDFLLTCLDPLYLRGKKSAKLLRFFFNQYRDTMFAQGKTHKSFTNHKHQCQIKEKVRIQAQSSEPCLDPKIDSSVLTIEHDDASKVDKELEGEKGKDKSDNGACRPKKRARPQEEEKSLSSSVADMPVVVKSEPEIEQRDLKTSSKGSDSSVPFKSSDSIGGGSDSSVPFKSSNSIGGGSDSSVPFKSSNSIGEGSDSSVPFKSSDSIGGGSDSSVPFKSSDSIGGATILNGAKESYEFLEEARAQMLKIGSLENGCKPAEKQFQEQDSLKKLKTGNSESFSGTEPKQKDQKQKAAQAHYHNPAAFLLNFSKPNVANGIGIGMGADLPARDQFLAANLTPPPAHQIPANQPCTKPQLYVMRKNLEIMISSLRGASASPVKQESGSALNGSRPELVEQMQGLLMKIEKKLGNSGASSSATVPGVLPP